MKKPIIRVILTIILILIIAFSFKSEERKDTNTKTTMPTTPAAPTATRTLHPRAPESQTPTQEQMAFVEHQLFPAFISIRDSYPLPKLRQEFARFLRRTERGGELRMRFMPNRMGVEDPPTAMANRTNGQRQMTLCIPAVIDLWNDVGEQETIKDFLVSAMLHEQYHIDHHLQSDTPVPYEQLVENESEAWWYTVEECYIPLIEAKRFTHLDTTDPQQTVSLGILAYKHAGGNRQHAAWKTFIQSVAPLPQ